MPFADGFFDAVISVDAYHYVGNNDTFFQEKVRPLLKQNGIAAISFPGMKYEVSDNIPEEMKPYWPDEALEMGCFEQAWNDWLNTDNPYAVEDRKMIYTDNGRYMNLIGITGHLE